MKNNFRKMFKKTKKNVIDFVKKNWIEALVLILVLSVGSFLRFFRISEALYKRLGRTRKVGIKENSRHNSAL